MAKAQAGPLASADADNVGDHWRRGYAGNHGEERVKAAITQRTNENIARVRNLVAIYQQTQNGDGRGRRGHAQTDVLRAATVLLHASLEDFLRSLAHWKLPQAGANALKDIPLVGIVAGSKINLATQGRLPGKNSRCRDQRLR